MLLPTELFGVVGHPLGQSLSPALHNWGFAKGGIAGVYMAWEIPPEKLEAFFVAVRTLPVRGGNITLPHKVASMSNMNTMSARAKAVGAVNVFHNTEEGLHGDNTDVLGFLTPLRERAFRSALVLGAGGASRAVIVGLQELGVKDIAVSNRSPQKADAFAGEFGIHALPWEDRATSGADLVINTTSLGMKGKSVADSPFPASGFRGKGVAYDIIYNPLQTRFLAEAEAAGWHTQDGLTMFVEQALASLRLWFPGKEPPADEAAALLRTSLSG